MNEKETEKRHLQVTRLQIALSICCKYPNAYSKVYTDKGYVMSEQENIAASVLKVILELEPSIKAELDFYLKPTLKTKLK